LLTLLRHFNGVDIKKHGRLPPVSLVGRTVQRATEASFR
jgi:hypothetical protein